jgi:hypothetical protein
MTFARPTLAYKKRMKPEGLNVNAGDQCSDFLLPEYELNLIYELHGQLRATSCPSVGQMLFYGASAAH